MKQMRNFTTNISFLWGRNREMSTYNQLMDNIQNATKETWLRRIVQGQWNDIRITDYAKQVVDLLDVYDPSMFDQEQNRNIQNWMRDLYNFLYTECFVAQRFSNSNWHAHRLWVMSRVAVILKNADMILILRMELKRYIQASILEYNLSASDYGILIDCKHRDSIEYHVYTLFAILNTIVLLERDLVEGVRTFRKIEKRVRWPEDRSLRNIVQPAIQFLLPYLNNQKTHLEFVDSNISADKTRPEHGKAYDVRNAHYLCRFMLEHNFW